MHSRGPDGDLSKLIRSSEGVDHEPNVPCLLLVREANNHTFEPRLAPCT